MEFTGERFVPELEGEIRHMHLHRYAISESYTNGKVVLDIASGEGYGAAFLARTASSVIGVDKDAAAVEHAKQAYAGVPNLAFREGSCEAIPLENQSVDVVTSFETIEHHDRHIDMMREVKRVLKPGGLLIISSPNRPLYSERFRLVNPFHIKELDQEELVSLLEDHFRFVHLYGHKLAAGSFVFPLTKDQHETFAAFDGKGVQIDRRTPVLNLPEFFIALCSDIQISPAPALGSVYVDSGEDLLQATHDELSWLRATYQRDRLQLEEIKSSLGFRLVTDVIWPVTRYVVPPALRNRIKTGARRLKRRVSRTNGSQAPSAPGGLALISNLGARDASGLVDFIPQKIGPLRLRISQSTPRRVNVLMSMVNMQYFFAGCMCMFNLALHLRRCGRNVRVLIVDHCDYDLPQWKKEIDRYPVLRTFFDEVEIAYVANRANAVDVSPADNFVATSWWTAHIAHQAANQLGQEKFIYLLQEYEPMFHPAGSLSALAEQALTFPHHAVFSTELLRDYFAETRTGIFTPGLNGGRPPGSIVIRNAANTFAIDEHDMRTRKKRKLLFYARPEQANNARNVFELGVIAIREALQEGHFDLRQWEFDGIGAMSDYCDLYLHRHVKMRMLPGMSLPDFIRILPNYDLGLSLMLTPHPSMMPLDMAAAGLVTVTNTYATKTREKMAAISHNIIAAPPTLEGLKRGLITALSEVENFDKRIAGSKLNWSMSWDETFSPEVMERINQYLDSTV